MPGWPANPYATQLSLSEKTEWHWVCSMYLHSLVSTFLRIEDSRKLIPEMVASLARRTAMLGVTPCSAQCHARRNVLHVQYVAMVSPSRTHLSLD